MRDDRAVEALDVVALSHDAPPPQVLEIVLELDAEGTVVPESIDPAVDVARRKDESAPRAQRDELVHPGEGLPIHVGSFGVLCHGPLCRARRAH
jgi:hypothetical protein